MKKQKLILKSYAECATQHLSLSLELTMLCRIEEKKNTFVKI